jgi:hypothetical protein
MSSRAIQWFSNPVLPDSETSSEDQAVHSTQLARPRVWESSSSLQMGSRTSGVEEKGGKFLFSSGNWAQSLSCQTSVLLLDRDVEGKGTVSICPLKSFKFITHWKVHLVRVPVILATQEAEIGKIVFQRQTRQTVCETLSEKTHHKKGLVPCLNEKKKKLFF